MTRNAAKEGKTLGIVSYLTFIGLLVAITMNLEKKNPYIFFHARQMLGLILMLIFSNLCERYVNTWVGTGLWIITFASWIYCLVFSFKGEARLLPYLGDYFQDWFKNLK
ncbi:MAG: hypothetical protein ED556_07760 [Winogradskyella sp.]|uniref:hypothetical protein n=1 Tax=Winogradskyella sp. TaxID=1883156 RepID=UPI000F3D5ABA|nr:hypothetical protein [Winogradskyella sp.]RNC87303.1 MAG: hypothetical protein ED556_07760 [Winogradskyella sp.]